MAARDGKRAARRPSQGREVLARIVELLLDTAVFVLAAFGLVGVAVVALEARGAPPAQTVFNLLIVCAVPLLLARLLYRPVRPWAVRLIAGGPLPERRGGGSGAFGGGGGDGCGGGGGNGGGGGC